MVEHSLDVRRVSGSSPLMSTKYRLSLFGDSLFDIFCIFRLFYGKLLIKNAQNKNVNKSLFLAVGAKFRGKFLFYLCFFVLKRENINV